MKMIVVRLRIARIIRWLRERTMVCHFCMRRIWPWQPAVPDNDFVRLHRRCYDREVERWRSQ